MCVSSSIRDIRIWQWICDRTAPRGDVDVLKGTPFRSFWFSTSSLCNCLCSYETGDVFWRWPLGFGWSFFFLVLNDRGANSISMFVHGRRVGFSSSRDFVISFAILEISRYDRELCPFVSLPLVGRQFFFSRTPDLISVWSSKKGPVFDIHQRGGSTVVVAVPCSNYFSLRT